MQPRMLGATGRTVTPFGLGGEGVLRTFGEERAAEAVIRRALAEGVTYFDSARAYAGSESYHGRVWGGSPELRARVFLTSKSASRDAEGARRDLARTLATLRVDRLDLWQIHDVRSDAELRAIARRGGALEAFLEAKERGQVAHVGVTGHHDPDVLLRAVRELPVDTVLLPINVVEGVLSGFLDRVLPEARAKGLGVVGMKVLGGGTFARAALSPRDLLRWALRQGADTLIVGCSSPEEVAANVAVASGPPMDEGEARALEERVRKQARALAYYRGD